MNTINRPSKVMIKNIIYVYGLTLTCIFQLLIQNDIESIGSAYASSVLEKMPQRPKKPLEMILGPTSPDAIDLVTKYTTFSN
jgi:hypothetical protein